MKGAIAYQSGWSVSTYYQISLNFNIVPGKFAVGDEIVSINGVSLGSKSLEDVTAIMVIWSLSFGICVIPAADVLEWPC